MTKQNSEALALPPLPPLPAPCSMCRGVGVMNAKRGCPKCGKTHGQWRVEGHGSAQPESSPIADAMRWLNQIELAQGGSNGPTVRLRAALSAIAALTPSPAPSAAPTPPVDAVPGEPVARVRVSEGHWNRGNYFDSSSWHADILPAGKLLPDGALLYAAPMALIAAPHQGADALREAAVKLLEIADDPMTSTDDVLDYLDDEFRAALAQYQALQQGEVT